MRGLSKLTAATIAPGRRTEAVATVGAYSTFSGSGRGSGRGGGRGSGGAPQPPRLSRVLGQSDPDVYADDEDVRLDPPGLGHGRGQPVRPSFPVLPAFSWMPSLKGSPDLGRGRGRAAPTHSDSVEGSSEEGSHAKKPVFLKREIGVAAPGGKPQAPCADDASPLPRRLSPTTPGVGRGKPSRPVESGPRVVEENRHLRRRSPTPSTETRTSSAPRTSLGQEEAVKKAMEVLSRGGPSGGRGRGDKGMTRGRGRVRGGRAGRGRGVDRDDDNLNIYLGDNADGEKLEKRLGEEKMKELTAQFEEMSYTALPSPMDDAYLDALHTNNMIEYEPEYLVNFDNPDIDEKPPMSLNEALEKAKPFLMAYEGIQSQEEWEEAVKDVMERLPVMKELMDMYCGPDRVTAKQQQQELERVAKTLPDNIPSSVKRFTDRALLSLQSNPGWGFDKKCEFMDRLVLGVSQHYNS